MPSDPVTRRLSRGVTLLCAVLALGAWDPFIKSNSDVDTGNDRVKQGKHKEALDAYDEAAKDLPRRPGVHYDRGVALYKLGKFEEAQKALLAATATTDPQLKRKAFFNRGNSLFQLKRWQGAIDAYRRALRVDPTHKPSKWNLELALRELEKKKKKDQQKKKNNKKNKKKNKQDDKKKQQKQDDDQKKKQDDQKKQQDKKKKQEIVLDPSYRPSEDEPFMNERQRAYFRNKLKTWKEEIIRQTRETLAGLHEDSTQHADLADRATSETDRALELRARDRQRKLVAKIDAALARIEDGSYGYCEETGEPIGLKRLDARPIATLSLEAQERHERRERVYRED